MNFTQISEKASLLREAYEIACEWEVRQFQGFLERALVSALPEIGIDLAMDTLTLEVGTPKQADILWGHKDFLTAASPASTIAIRNAQTQQTYLFERDAVMSSASNVAQQELKPDIIKRVEDCPYSAALCTWSDVLLFPNGRIILYPDRSTHPDETIILFGHQMIGSMHPEDKAILYRESRQNGVTRMPVRKRYHNGVWGVADMICEFLIYRGHECRFTQVVTKEPLDPAAFF